MGNNCACLTSKENENDLTLLNENRHHFLINDLQKMNNSTLINYIISIQSHIRGLIYRKKFRNKIFLIGKFIPYMEPGLPYKPAENCLITNEEKQSLFSDFPPLEDKVAVVCLKTIEYINGCQYYGEWSQQNNTKHGRGIQKWPEGLTYYGQFRNDKAHGKGRLVFKEGEEYEGDWVDNKANGYGIYKSKEVKYEGKWKDDRQDGIGTESWSDGTNYTGEFKAGQKTGEGKFKYGDGSYYSGTFLNNKLHGKGLYVWADGREYNGDWKQNRIEGEGVFKWPDGRKYIGHYKNDKKNGYGIFEWPDGKKYKGFWENGKQNGEGECYNPRENIWIKGFWKNGKKQTSSKNISDTSKSSSKSGKNIIPSNKK